MTATIKVAAERYYYPPAESSLAAARFRGVAVGPHEVPDLKVVRAIPRPMTSAVSTWNESVEHGPVPEAHGVAMEPMVSALVEEKEESAT